MIQFITLLLVAFFLKTTAVVLTAAIINKKYKNFLGSIVGSYCLIQIFIIAQMLVLSLFNAITPINLWLILIIFNLCLIATIKKQQITFSFDILKSIKFSNISTIITLSCILAIFIFLTVRSFYYFDNTMDALNYELTRIFVFAQAHSLLTLQPTIVKAIFCYAWNGEINALFYLLMTNNDQATSFSNVEIWLFLCLSFAWLSSIFKSANPLCTLGGLVLASSPVWFGLVTTVKGDLLMAAAFISGMGFLWHINKSKILSLDYIFVAAALGLAGGSKTTALPFALLAGTQLLFFYLSKAKKAISITTLLVCIGIFLITNIRYFINVYQFNEPFKNYEHTQFSFSNFSDNLIGVFRFFFDRIDIENHWTVSSSALGTGFEYLSVGFIIWFILQIVFKYKSFPGSLERNNKEDYLWKILTISSLCISTAFVLCMLPWRPWSFRHYAPFFFVPLTYLFSITASYIKKPSHQLIATSFWLIFVAINFFVTFPFKSGGEITPVPFKIALSQSQMEREIALHSYLWNSSTDGGLSTLNIVSSKRKNIIVLNDLGTPVAPLFGINRQNKVTFVDSMDTLNMQLAKHHYDLIVLESKVKETHIVGYKVKIMNKVWTVFVPERE